jgi:NADP-dependent 3-hydroxy acid dehydrogenase YdfG
VLISNAGVGPISKLEDLRAADWEAMIDVNGKGLLYGIAAALPIFRQQGFGHFVNTISTADIQMSPTMAVYAATKNAVRTLCEGLRIEAEGQISSDRDIARICRDQLRKIDDRSRDKGANPEAHG